MRLPAVLSRSFWELLAKAAEEFGVTRSEMATRALKHYIKELRLRKSPVTGASDEEGAKLYAKVQSKLAKNFWASVSPEERKKRTAKANAARWGKPKKK